MRHHIFPADVARIVASRIENEDVSTYPVSRELGALRLMRSYNHVFGG